DNGKIAMTARELAKGVTVTCSPARKSNRFDQLIVSARRRHQSVEEIRGLYAAFSRGGGELDIAFEGNEGKRDLRAGVGKRHRAANGAAGTGLGVSDPGQSKCQQRLMLGKPGPGQKLRLAHAGTDADRLILDCDRSQLGEMHDVD